MNGNALPGVHEAISTAQLMAQGGAFEETVDRPIRPSRAMRRQVARDARTASRARTRRLDRVVGVTATPHRA